jgi:hypothetical protein
VTKHEGGKGGGTTTFVWHRDSHQGKPYTSSYTYVRRHLCGGTKSDDNKGAIRTSIFLKIS